MSPGPRTLVFAVQLHGPFLVGTGLAGDGLDDIANHSAPLPASSLKGLMRDAAAHRLALDPALVRDIFGAPGRESAWAWSDAGEPSMYGYLRRSRNRVDSGTGVAAREALATVEEVWVAGADRPEFTVTALLPTAPRDHELALIAAAHAVTAVGKWRNRGMGTASIRPVPALDPDAARELTAWVIAHRVAAPPQVRP